MSDAPPYLADLAASPEAPPPGLLRRGFQIATYNVHRWAGVRGGRQYAPERVGAVLDEIGADVVALQEVLRPTGGDDPLREIARGLGMHLAFVVTRMHKRGELGNAVLSRWPLAGAEAIDLTFSRIERRAALAVRLSDEETPVRIVSTHLAIVDRIRTRQVQALLQHPHLGGGPTVLLGDMNAWRKTPASRGLDAYAERHHNARWPASWPSVRPVLALDRVYASGARVTGLHAHETAASRQASDHLPIVGMVEVGC
ncbi:MAG: endonuclease/exonuclease/phosphatase family protein [Bacteroidota bacterium]